MEYKVGEKIEIEITDISNEGMGVGKHNGFTFFIEGCTIGDKVLFEIIKLKKNFGIGKTIEIIQPSPYRQEPACEYFHQCDGCELQDLKYEKQLELRRI